LHRHEAFIKGTADSLPNAAITFDKFHAVKIINDAVDQVRRTERKDHKLLALPLVAQPGSLIRAPEGQL
jgi:transposase